MVRYGSDQREKNNARPSQVPRKRTGRNPFLSARHQCLAIALILAVWSQDSRADPRAAVPTADFLNSIGVVSTFPDRGQPLAKTVEMVRYCGFRWVRAGIEGLTDNGPTTMRTFLELHRQTGARP